SPSPFNPLTTGDGPIFACKEQSDSEDRARGKPLYFLAVAFLPARYLIAIALRRGTSRIIADCPLGVDVHELFRITAGNGVHIHECIVSRGPAGVGWLQERRSWPMRRSIDRILTTHAGSLPRPPDLTRMMWDVIDGKPVDQAALRTRVRVAVAE